MLVELTGTAGRVLDARVDAGDSALVIHSRSGTGPTARNSDYRPALELMLRRLQNEGVPFEVYRDSTREQATPLPDRRIATSADLTGEVPEQFNELIRRTNAGSSSHGAWRRLLFKTAKFPDFALASLVDGSAAAAIATGGLPRSELRKVTAPAVEAAIREVQSGRPRFTRFTEATGYLLVPADGAPVPPKQVFGIALSDTLRTYTTPQHFSSGRVIFEILDDLGFDVRPLAEVPRAPRASAPRPSRPTPEQVAAELADLPVTDEERVWVEGNLRAAKHLRRERAPGLAKEKKAAMIAAIGKLACERCDDDLLDRHGPGVVDACFEVHHTHPIAQMQEGHQTVLADLQVLCANCHRAVHRELARA